MRSITSRINVILQGNNNVHMIRDCVQQVYSTINGMQKVISEHNFRLGMRNYGESFTSEGSHSCLGKNVRGAINA